MGMSQNEYPLHPGQAHAEPLYVQVPLEEYEGLKKKINILETDKAELKFTIVKLQKQIIEIAKKPLITEKQNVTSRKDH